MPGGTLSLSNILNLRAYNAQAWRLYMTENISISKESEKFQTNEMKKEQIVEMLKSRHCRITRQRLMLLDIILEEDCSC